VPAADVVLNQLVRYARLVPLVEEVSGSELLDVGSGSQGIARYLSPRFRVTACDLDFSDYGARPDQASLRARRVEGSVLDLPFPDAAFDVVVALDLLEHVAAGSRARALSELARVSRRRVVVGCPCGSRALDSDTRLARWYVRLGRQLPPWLSEHLENGFPDTVELRTGLAPFGTVRVIPSEAIWAHEAVARVEAVPVAGLLSPLLSKALVGGVRPEGTLGVAAELVLRGLAGGDRSPSYRAIAILDR
jgi:SAM-dependent methyltransferase